MVQNKPRGNLEGIFKSLDSDDCRSGILVPNSGSLGNGCGENLGGLVDVDLRVGFGVTTIGGRVTLHRGGGDGVLLRLCGQHSIGTLSEKPQILCLR